MSRLIDIQVTEETLPEVRYHSHAPEVVPPLEPVYIKPENTSAKDSTSSKDPLWKRKRWLLILIAVIVAIAIGVGVGVGVGARPKSASPTER